MVQGYGSGLGFNVIIHGLGLGLGFMVRGQG